MQQPQRLCTEQDVFPRAGLTLSALRPSLHAVGPAVAALRADRAVHIFHIGFYPDPVVLRELQKNLILPLQALLRTVRLPKQPQPILRLAEERAPAPGSSAPPETDISPRFPIPVVHSLTSLVPAVYALLPHSMYSEGGLCGSRGKKNAGK